MGLQPISSLPLNQMDPSACLNSLLASRGATGSLRGSRSPGEVEDLDGERDQDVPGEVEGDDWREEGEDQGKEGRQQPAKEAIHDGPGRLDEEDGGRDHVVVDDEAGEEQEEEEDEDDAEEEVAEEDGQDDGEDLP
ncbi:UNVERIFIED_CONTAM: hypothetical protein K2H54_006674 [Gekko kuhli]